VQLAGSWQLARDSLDSTLVTGANKCSSVLKEESILGLLVCSLIMLIVLVMETRSHANHSLEFASKFHNHSRQGSRMGRWLAVSTPGLSICNSAADSVKPTDTHTKIHTRVWLCVQFESKSKSTSIDSRPRYTHFIMNSWLGLLADTFTMMLHSPFSIICVVCYYFSYGQQLAASSG